MTNAPAQGLRSFRCLILPLALLVLGTSFLVKVEYAHASTQPNSATCPTDGALGFNCTGSQDFPDTGDGSVPISTLFNNGGIPIFENFADFFNFKIARLGQGSIAITSPIEPFSGYFALFDANGVYLSEIVEPTHYDHYFYYIATTTQPFPSVIVDEGSQGLCVNITLEACTSLINFAIFVPPAPMDLTPLYFEIAWAIGIAVFFIFLRILA